MPKKSVHLIGIAQAVTGGKKQIIKNVKQPVDTARNVVRKKVQEFAHKK